MKRDRSSTETGFLYSIANSGQYDRLITYLGSSEPRAVRKKAANLLTQSLESLVEQDTDPIIEKLYTTVLVESDESVRADIIEVLIYIADSPIDTLVTKIESREYPTPTGSPPPLLYVGWLDSRHVELRLVAVAGLGRVGTKQVVPKLVVACRDDDKRIQIRALDELGEIGDPRCVDAVKTCLQTTDRDVKTAAAHCLARIGTADALAAIMPLSKKGDLRLRRAIVSELGTTGSISVFGILLREIANPESRLKESAIRSAVELIAHAKPSNSHAVRITVGTHLEQVADEDTIDTLSAVAEAPTPQIRRNAIWLLCQLIDPAAHTESLDKLIAAITDDDETTAKMTVSKLAKCRDPVVIDRLEAFIKTHDVDSRACRRADYIRDQIEKKTPDDRLKDAVEYTKVSDPADYTKKHANE